MKRVFLTGLLATSTLALGGFLGSMLPACGPPALVAAPNPAASSLALSPIVALPEEKHLADLRQLTLAGENAEAYWSNDGKQLILQSRTGDSDCDRIHRLPLNTVLPLDSRIGGRRDAVPPLVPVSSGKGATTCSYFMPGDKQVIYASTHLGGDACPPKPDHSLGYVWALYDTYDIFKADVDGKNVVRLTDTKGYDAEATVCAKDGSILFTSVRDGDIDLYRMDADGKNVKRLTNTPGYDGGAFFNADCSKIVWRASRPKGKDLEDFKKLLSQNLVRPSKLELYVANADGSEAMQLTYLDAASFAPFWHPSQKRILFSSNHGDPKGREFDIWSITTNGTGLERITYASGFDGFPMFSPDGKTMAFSSNRATPKGKHDTNVFLARWVEEGNGPKEEQASDRVMSDIAWLADPARDGRGIGTLGLEKSGAYLEERFKALGLTPAGDKATGYRQAFPVVTSLKAEDATALGVDGKSIAKEDYVVLGYSASKADVKGDMVLAGYGIVAKDAGVDDYAKLDVKKKIVVVRRFAPEGGKLGTTEAQRRFGDIRRKAFTAREKGAAALVVIDEPLPPEGAKADWKAPDEAKLPPLVPEGYSDAGLPVIVLRRSVGKALVERLAKRGAARASLKIELSPVSQSAFNVVGRVNAEPSDGKKLPGVVVVGAHYDHLGRGGRYSLAPLSDEPHVGADDNASGAAVLLEVARDVAARKNQLKHDVVFVAFSGEESGVLGSAHLVHAWIDGASPDHAGARSAPGASKAAGKLDDVVAMLNMDMVGRMRENRLQVLGAETAGEWKDLVQTACDRSRVECAMSGDGYGPSDQISFYAGGVPVLHFFTGSHSDYHKPSDTSEKINAAGAAQTGKICGDVTVAIAQRDKPLTFKSGIEGGGDRGDLRSFNASLGTIPDYGGPGPGKKGVLLSGVRPGSAADKGGLQKGDVLVRLGKSEIASVEDLMFVLNAHKPGETVPAVVMRDGKEVRLEVTFQESHGRK